MNSAPVADLSLAADEIAGIAEEAYLYAHPMLVAYAFFHAQALGPDRPEKQAINRFTHFRTLANPTLNNTIPWVNTDTLYSAVWLDLRAEPMVLSTPEFELHRFQDIQANDWQTMAFLTRGTRDRGNVAATYMFAGPGWQGERPRGVDEVIVADSWFVKLFARIVVEGPGDEAAIHGLQDSYRLEPLSAFRREPPPPPAAPITFPPPDPAGYRDRAFFEQPTPDFIRYFNFLMTLATVHPSERTLFERFGRIGVRPGAAFDAAALPTETAAAIQRGIDAATARIRARLAHLDDPVNGWVYPLDLRGGREVLAGSFDAYLRRAVLARFAIWGPPAEEVVYMNVEVDALGAPLDGSRGAYQLRFEGPPPARGFWSFTVYDAQTRLLAAHPSGRYKRGDRDWDLVRGPDGSITLYLQHEPPTSAPKANWLPVPQGTFQVV
ncbi:MAG TPA: DUF1254 domain-containing protein, partial [Phenylobacterium sp.]|nr:DUF1254 domain-containing protein [Phenylobacterium sp.]